MDLHADRTGSLLSSLLTGATTLVIILFLFYVDLSLFLIVLLLGGAGIIFLYTQSWAIKDHYLVIFLLFAGLLSPPLQLPGGLPEIRLEEIIAFTYLPVLVLIRREYLSDQLLSFLKYYGIFLGFLTLSTLYGYALLDVPFGMRDVFEIIKTAKYGFIIGAIGSFAFSKTEVRYIFIWLILLFSVSTLIGQMQYHSILGLDRITAPYFVQERIYDVNRRMMGTFYNPNTYGTAISIGFIFTLAYTFYTKNISRKLVLFVLMILMLGTVILTQSRTALGVLLIGLLLFVILNSLLNNTNAGLALGIIFLFFLVLAGFLAIVSPDIIKRYTSLLNIMEDLSWQMRLFAWYLNLEIFSRSFVIGWGPAKHLYTTVVDSEYILMLRTLGVTGFVAYIYAVYILPFRQSKYLIRRVDIYGYFSRAFVIALIIFLTANLTNPLFHEIQFMDVWSILIGLIYAVTSSSNKENE